MTTEEFLIDLMPGEEAIERFLDKTVYLEDPERNNKGRTYNPELGFLIKDYRSNGGMGRSRYLATFDAKGARTPVNFPEKTPRISSYGDSFTMCNQVNNGETWQEYLAANIGEPIANYGIGGYSVYQACLRLRREEGKHPSEVIILNIYNDDHYRNLDAWKSIRRGSISANGNGFAMPYLYVSPATGEVEERANPTPTTESVRRFSDLSWIVETFHREDNFPLRVAMEQLALKGKKVGKDAEVEVGTGEATRRSVMTDLQREHADRALRSTEYLVNRLIEEVTATDRKLLFVLSYPDRYIHERITYGERWDEPFIAYLEATQHPVVDLCEAHRVDYQTNFRCSLDSYLARFFIGHYNPAGNHFQAMAIRESLLSLLSPPPPVCKPSKLVGESGKTHVSAHPKISQFSG